MIIVIVIIANIIITIIINTIIMIDVAVLLCGGLVPSPQCKHRYLLLW